MEFLKVSTSTSVEYLRNPPLQARMVIIDFGIWILEFLLQGLDSPLGAVVPR